MTDERDRRTLSTLLKKFYRKEVLEEGFTFDDDDDGELDCLND